MTAAQLKQYPSDYRNDDEKFSKALSELLSHDPNPTIYPADMPLEEMGRTIIEKIEQGKQSKET